MRAGMALMPEEKREGNEPLYQGEAAADLNINALQPTIFSRTKFVLGRYARYNFISSRNQMQWFLKKRKRVTG
jgi:hypothetical protein